MKLKKVMALTMAGAMAATTLTALPQQRQQRQLRQQQPQQQILQQLQQQITVLPMLRQFFRSLSRTPFPSRLDRAGRKLRRSSKRNPAARWQSRSTRIPSLVISLP